MLDFIQVDGRDNVITALRDLPTGTRLDAAEPCQALLLQDIMSGHKAAVCDIAAGAEVIKYGKVIGLATAPIRAGEHVHVHNVTSLRGKYRK